MNHASITVTGRPFSRWPWRIFNREGLLQLVGVLSTETHETMLALYVTTDFEMLAIDMLGKGSISQVKVKYRDVLTRASLVGAGAFFLVHNHPSGDPRPSQADLDYTVRMKRLSYEMDMPLLDHFVVAGGRIERVGPGLFDGCAEPPTW